MRSGTPLRTGERVLLFLPIPGAVFFGLGPFLLPGVLIPWLGYAGDDPYIARLAGAAVFGYAVALTLAIRDGDWLASRFLVVATLVFNLAALLACAIEVASRPVQPVVPLIVANSLVQASAMAWLLVRHRASHGGKPDIPRSAVALVVFATLAAGGHGQGPVGEPGKARRRLRRDPFPQLRAEPRDLRAKVKF
jgi:hypothetical protein